MKQKKIQTSKSDTQYLVQITWNIIWENIYKNTLGKTLNLSLEDFFKYLLPNEFYNTLFDNPEQKSESARKNTRHRILHATNGANKRFEETKHYLLSTQNAKTGEIYRFDNFPLLEEIAYNWKCLLDTVPEKTELLEESLTDLLNEYILPEEPLKIVERIHTLNNQNKHEKMLACLSLIASTIPYWRTLEMFNDPGNSTLYALILPVLPNQEISSPLKKVRSMLDAKSTNFKKMIELLKYSKNEPTEQPEAYFLLSQIYSLMENPNESNFYFDKSVQLKYLPAIREKNQKHAEKLLQEARKIFNEPQNDCPASVNRCCKNCMEILNYGSSISTVLRGEASFYIYKYSLAGKYKLPSGESPYQYLNQSHFFQFPSATIPWNEYNHFQITPQIKPAANTKLGECIFNTENSLYELFIKSMPGTWKSKLFSSSSVWELLTENIPRKFLFLSDNFQQNIHDTLQLLQLIKDNKHLSSVQKIEIYLRAKEITARPIIDTAMSHMGDIIIAVRIIEDEKWAAQQLLSAHPLFYPIRSVPASYDNKITLHFIILGDSPTAEWLIREAFWMMSFRNENIVSKITLLAPDGISVENKLKGNYPGLAKDKINITNINFADFTGKSIDFNSYELNLEIEKLYQEPNTYCYFAVATNDDHDNLSYAMKIRELIIQSTIKSHQQTLLDNPPPVAFLCKDDYLSWTSKSMVIEVEDFGNQWFNTWSLIPFGEASAKYVWDKIDGGILEDLAKCIHLQYSGISCEATTYQTEEFTQAIKEYYRRQYNHDSSYSLALSMPYRLFQYHDKFGAPILPHCWSILDSTAYSTLESLQNLAERLNYLNYSSKKEEELRSLSIWEHNRWIRWMLSRGWLPASFEDAVFAYKNGNRRQQLFVARLHPCLCSYEELKDLSILLEKECGIKKDFYSMDRKNIESTKELLELKWLNK